jgi:AP-2 complex subunit alpha
MLILSGQDPQLSSYQRKKYVSKLIFVYILGYKVDVGHFEAANLVTSNKYTEKQIVRPSAVSTHAFG